jgi:hypothetical protein
MALSPAPLLARKKLSPVPASLEAGLGMGATAANPFTAGHWTQSIIIRLVLGVGFAAGLGIAAERLTEGVLLLLNEPIQPFWNSLNGFLVMQAGQVLALFLATLLAAAGKKNAIFLGLLLGAVVGFGRMAVAVQPPDVPGLVFALMPIWYVLVGIAGAFVSEMIWHPPSRERPRNLNAMGGYDPDQSLFQWARRGVAGMIFANVKWLRILLAAIVILAALRFMGDGVNYVIRLLDLREWAIKSGLQKGILIILLQVVTVCIASALAGAGQNHGLAHGFWTGVIAGVANLLIHVFFPKEDIIQVNQILLEIGWVFCVAFLAGGFGSVVMPPMMYLARKRRPAVKV